MSEIQPGFSTDGGVDYKEEEVPATPSTPPNTPPVQNGTSVPTAPSGIPPTYPNEQPPITNPEFSPVRQEIIEDVMIELGYPVVTLFITQEQINRMIDFAVRKCANKACPRFLATMYAAGCVNVAQWDMEAVSAVYMASGIGSGTSSSGSSNNGTGSGSNSGCGCSCGASYGSSISDLGCNICDKLCRYRGYSFGLMRGDWDNEIYNLLAWQNAKSQWDSMTLYDWYLDNQNQRLYLDNYSGMITVEYTKSHITIENLEHDTTWLSWVRDYTLALCKIIEGRIRGKFKASSAPFEIEADELISEGNSDKQELETKLDEDIGYYNIMRSSGI